MPTAVVRRSVQSAAQRSAVCRRSRCAGLATHEQILMHSRMNEISRQLTSGIFEDVPKEERCGVINHSRLFSACHCPDNAGAWPCGCACSAVRRRMFASERTRVQLERRTGGTGQRAVAREEDQVEGWGARARACGARERALCTCVA